MRRLRMSCCYLAVVALPSFASAGPIDVVTAPGERGGNAVKSFDTPSLTQANAIAAYDNSVWGRINVAAGQLGGVNVIATVPGSGGSSDVRVFGAGGGGLSSSFFAFDQTYLGGSSIAVGFDRLIVGALQGSQVSIFDAAGTSTASFLAYDPSFTGGVNVAAGRASGRDVILTGAATGSGRFDVFDALTLAPVASAFAFDPGYQGGITVASGRYAGEDAFFIGANTGSRVKILRASDLGLLADFFAFAPSYQGGVTLAGSVFGNTDSLIVGTARGGGQVSVFDTGSGNLQLLASFLPYGSGFVSGVSVAGAPTPAAVPETGTWLMLLTGFVGIGVARRSRRWQGRPA